MPHNRISFEVVRYTLAKSQWKKSDDGFYYVQFKPSDVSMIMQGLDIKDGDVFKDAVNCLCELTQEHIE
jgi:hypothetical protein